MINAVVLDFDDTLALTEKTCFNLENRALKIMHRKPMTRQLHKATWGIPTLEIIKQRSPGINVDRFKKIYINLLDEAINQNKLEKIPAENYQTLDNLIALGKTIIIVTSRSHFELRHLLEPCHLLAKRIKTIYYKDITRYHKPDPRVFDEMFREYGFKPNECVYVGDSLSDGQAANQAGMYFIASLENGFKTKQDFNGIMVNGFIDKFADLEVAIDNLTTSPE